MTNKYKDTIRYNYLKKKCKNLNEYLGYISFIRQEKNGQLAQGDVICFPTKPIELSPTYASTKVIIIRTEEPTEKEKKEFIESFRKLDCKAVLELWVYLPRHKKPKVFILDRN